MSPILVITIFLTIIILVLGAIIFSLLKKNSSDASGVDPNLFLNTINDLRRELQQTNNKQQGEMTNRLDRMHDQLVKNLTNSSGTLQKHFTHTSGLIRDVTERLTKLDETNKQVLGFSEQLQSLENILKNPKKRGILGEYWLETLLSQVLQPTQYSMQHDLGKTEDGSNLIPDAVIFVKDLIIPIDAKFSLENYNRIQQALDAKQREKLERDFKSDVKKRIDETSKYIRPTTHGTTNFAFMFVPAEGVYHNLIGSSVGAVSVNSRNLIEYAFEKGVMIVSPTSFFAYLQTVLHGLKALQIEESVKQIQKHTEQLMKHLRAYEEQHNKVGKHLQTTYRAYTDASKELKKIDKDVYRITDGAAGKELNPLEIEPLRLDKAE